MFNFDEIVSFASTLTVTKRNILKITKMFFDPLGFLCPIFLQAKLIFNKICISRTGWDSEVPVEIEKNWKLFLNFFKNLNDISFDHSHKKQIVWKHGLNRNLYVMLKFAERPKTPRMTSKKH